MNVRNFFPSSIQTSWTSPWKSWLVSHPAMRPRPDSTSATTSPGRKQLECSPQMVFTGLKLRAIAGLRPITGNRLEHARIFVHHSPLSFGTSAGPPHHLELRGHVRSAPDRRAHRSASVRLHAPTSANDHTCPAWVPRRAGNCPPGCGSRTTICNTQPRPTSVSRDRFSRETFTLPSQSQPIRILHLLEPRHPFGRAVFGVVAVPQSQVDLFFYSTGFRFVGIHRPVPIPHRPRRAEGQHFEVAAQLLAVPHLSMAALGVLAAARLDVDFLQADSLRLLQFRSFLWCHLMSQ